MYQSFIVVIFPWLCGYGGRRIMFFELLHIYPGRLGGFSHYFCVHDDWVRYGLKAAFVCLHITLCHYNHDADLSESIEPIVRYILLSVCLRLPIPSITFYAICVAVFSAFSASSIEDYESICTLS